MLIIYTCILHHCTLNLVSSVCTIFYNAGRAPYNVLRVPPGHRPMSSYTDAGRRPYDMWPRISKFLSIARCPGDYQTRGNLQISTKIRRPFVNIALDKHNVFFVFHFNQIILFYFFKMKI